MASSQSWRTRVADSFGPLGAVRSLGGSAWQFTAAGRTMVAKAGPAVSDEADGLRHLAAIPGAPAVPEALLCDSDLLVIEWIEPGLRTREKDELLGRQLAVLHAAGGGGWGGGSSWIGNCRITRAEFPDGPSFYGARFTELARQCGLEKVVAPVAGRLDALAPFGAPALLHGDLWWGNVLWGADGRPWLIDPSYHGGHPEEDLAMLALFGAVPSHLFAAYQEVSPLADGWEQRVELWQLYPLLVHTILFNGGYRSRAEEIARRFG